MSLIKNTYTSKFNNFLVISFSDANETAQKYFPRSEFLNIQKIADAKNRFERLFS